MEGMVDAVRYSAVLSLHRKRGAESMEAQRKLKAQSSKLKGNSKFQEQKAPRATRAIGALRFVFPLNFEF
jgi:hypothetical protein